MQSVGSSERRASDIGQDDETREDRGMDRPETESPGRMVAGNERGQGLRGGAKSGSRGRKSAKKSSSVSRGMTRFRESRAREQPERFRE